MNFLMALGITYSHGGNARIFDLYSDDLQLHSQYASIAFESLGNGLPHLPRTIFRIDKAFYQGSLPGLTLFHSQRFFHRVHYGFDDRKAFNALGTPLCTDFAAWHTPNLFGVLLEELVVKRPSEAIDQKIFQRFLRNDRPHTGASITNSKCDHFADSQFSEAASIYLERIIEKLLVEIYS